ncbi:MAG: hypothetical protein K8F91_08740 [Candidatus Obscuribacterales bacterium]|nr:hypothetical protein [Candidatus Obscuribacterales bacterium]
MASAPEEDTLMFATRVRSGAFKQALTTMPVGGDIKVDISSAKICSRVKSIKTSDFEGSIQQAKGKKRW